MKKFDLSKALAGHAVIRGDGCAVKELHLLTSPGLDCPLIAVIENCLTLLVIETFTIDGRYSDDCDEDRNNLFMAPTKKKLWIAVFKDLDVNHSHFVSGTFESKEKLMNIYCRKDAFHAIEIEIEE